MGYKMTIQNRRSNDRFLVERILTIGKSLQEETLSISREDKKRLYAALRSELNNLSVQNIRNTVAAAGFDVSEITAKDEARSGIGSRAEVMPAVDRLFGQMSESAQETALRILAERLTEHDPDLRTSTQDILGRHWLPVYWTATSSLCTNLTQGRPGLSQNLPRKSLAEPCLDLSMVTTVALSLRPAVR